MEELQYPSVTALLGPRTGFWYAYTVLRRERRGEGDWGMGESAAGGGSRDSTTYGSKPGQPGQPHSDGVRVAQGGDQGKFQFIDGKLPTCFFFIAKKLVQPIKNSSECEVKPVKDHVMQLVFNSFMPS